jgi:methylase of polypeptide subunit release factors
MIFRTEFRTYWHQKENDRLDLFHHLLTLRLDDKLHLAPIGSNPQSVLDLGTGSGIWAIEMGLHQACYPY